MLFTYMTYSAYELYVALLDALISVAVALSVVVSLDRVFHVVKYAQLKARSRVTGRKPEDYYQFDPLPDPVRCTRILSGYMAEVMLAHVAHSSGMCVLHSVEGSVRRCVMTSYLNTSSNLASPYACLRIVA